MSYQIRRLNFGAVTIDAAMKVRGIPPGTRVDVPAQGYLIMGDTGPILVDAGYRDPSVLGLGGRVGPGQGFHEQLAAHGVRAGDLACVIMTHLHRDHAGHLDKVPMHVPVVVNRSEMASACSGVQGTAYARDDIHHLLDRVYTPGALRFLDLEYSGPIELAGGITCQLTGGHTPGSISIIVPTGYGQACLCGDLFYDIYSALVAPPRQGPVAGVQPHALVAGEPALTNNFTTAVLQEIGAVKRALRYRYLLPAHDAPGVLEAGRLVGRIDGDVVPGPVSPLAPPPGTEITCTRSS
jgi:glyoxylase-like metal-dependent hydrolase (beta-lactamase superfamily II)